MVNPQLEDSVTLCKFSDNNIWSKVLMTFLVVLNLYNELGQG